MEPKRCVRRHRVDRYLERRSGTTSIILRSLVVTVALAGLNAGTARDLVFVDCGDTVQLIDPQREIVDSVVVPGLDADISYGRAGARQGSG